MGYMERVAKDDALRAALRSARTWRVPPTVFLRERTVDSGGWTDSDTAWALALEDYEAGLCPGGEHVLAETTLPEHEMAYRPDGEGERCHYCAALRLLEKQMGERDNADGVLLPKLVLDPDAVARNRQPAPPIPPELGG